MHEEKLKCARVQFVSGGHFQCMQLISWYTKVNLFGYFPLFSHPGKFCVKQHAYQSHFLLKGYHYDNQIHSLKLAKESSLLGKF